VREGNGEGRAAKDRGNNLSGTEASLACGKCLTDKWPCRGELELPKRRPFKAPTKALLTECGDRGQVMEKEPGRGGGGLQAFTEQRQLRCVLFKRKRNV